MEVLNLPPATQQHLDDKQGVIDGVPAYDQQVAEGKRLWKNKSRAHFDQVRVTLKKMCVGAQRCNYCEDSAADEIEHIKPKDFYPEQAFKWGNYLLSCGLCNRPKSNRCAIFGANGAMVSISRSKNEPVVPPPNGADVFINPRVDNPLDFMMLDLNTALFIALPHASSQDQNRANYTIEILRLNARDYLIKARKQAYNDYLNALDVYVSRKNNGADSAELNQIQNDLESRHHPTVWHEMQRLRTRLPHLGTLFQDAAELCQIAGI